VGKDKPFDLRAPDDAVRIDVKTQKNGELNVKREKFGKQFLAWAAAGERFLPVQVVVDSKTAGWYLVPGIPMAARTPLDPLDTVFDPNDPGRPFCIGQCLLVDLKTRERFEAMRAKLNQGLKDVKKNKERILARVREEHQEYINEVAQHAIDNDKMHAAVIRSIASSDKAINNLVESDEAMAKFAHSDKAMAKLAHSDEAIAKLAESDEAMAKLAQSDQAIAKLAQSDEAMAKLADSDEAMAKLAQSDKAMARLAQSREAMAKLAQSDEAMANLAQSDEAMMRMLGPEMFQTWKAQRSKPAE